MLKMPAYYSVFFTLEEFHLQRSLPLVSIYEALLSEFKFGGEFGAEDYVNVENFHNSLESIIAWNQTKIDKNCNKASRGEDYRQFC